MKVRGRKHPPRPNACRDCHKKLRVSMMCGGIPTSELVRSGRYDWVNPSITDELFPIETRAPVSRTIELIRFNHYPHSGEVLVEFARRGLERPTYEDALTFGVEHPEEQMKSPIVFLCEPVRADGRLNVIVLRREEEDERYLDLFQFNTRWFPIYLLAAIRK